jgi:hypothetical protein
MLDKFGVEGMSSDEEDYQPDGTPQYLVLVPRWRDSKVTFWLRVFDLMVIWDRRNRGESVSRGAHPRRRTPTRRISQSTKFVAGLPINAYHPEWLRNRLEVKNTVHPDPTPYLFNHHHRIAEYVPAL